MERNLRIMQQPELGPDLIFITGGARSGKSQLAEKLAKESGRPVVYLATMSRVAHDQELDDRIARHAERRPAGWRTIEEPLMPERAIKEVEDGCLVLIDCLSLYVSNLLLGMPYAMGPKVTRELEENVLKEVENFLSVMVERSDLSFILVSNEVGSAIVPDNHLARNYRDLLGLANQKAAQMAREAYLCVSGLSLKLKPQ
jgi:adenosylcobinamide kinase/adenosylcobinamide-phosphate guanylyltransferase